LFRFFEESVDLPQVIPTSKASKKRQPYNGEENKKEFLGH